MKAVFAKFLIFALAIFAVAVPVFAKGQVALMTITAPGSGQKPIEITDPQVLSQFSFWSDQLFAPGQSILAQPPKIDRIYQVSFYMKDEAGELQLRYAFQYAEGEPAAIYLPGRGEPGYILNVGTWLRDGMDGHWFRASQSWVRFMQRTLAGQVSQNPTSFSPGLAVASAAALAVAGFGLWFFIAVRKRYA